MKLKLIKLTTVIFLLFLFSNVFSQSEYKAEIGIHSGVSYYLGDANSLIFNHPELDYGLVFRYNFNERLAAHAEFNNTVITDGIFSNPVNSFDLYGEFNFFDFVYKQYKPASRKYTTYLMAGVGVMYYQYNSVPQIKVSYPFGVGFKVRLLERLKLNVQWTHKLLLSDQLEGLPVYNNPWGLNGSNLLNNDLLSEFTIGLTYDIFKKGCNCYNTLY